MRGDIPEAAFRLMLALPVRTHTVALAPDDGRMRHCENNVRECVVHGVHYESLSAAGRALGKSRGAIRNMIYAGEARYL